MTPVRPTLRLRQQLPTFSAFIASIMSSSSTQPTEFKPIINALPRSSYPSTITFSPSDLRRIDESPDTQFYSSPRFVHHIDDSCISRLKAYYNQVITSASSSSSSLSLPLDSTSSAPTIANQKLSILDLCTSWTSHLPDTLLPNTPTSPISSITGIGLNAKELSANPHLTSKKVIDLNTTPHFQDVEDESVDVVICSVSVDYLTKPVEIVGEIRRVLRPGGTVHFSFSNRCFPTKVIQKWLRLTDQERRRRVASYIWKDNDDNTVSMTTLTAPTDPPVSTNSTDPTKPTAQKWEQVEEIILNDNSQYEDPLFIVRARKTM